MTDLRKQHKPEGVFKNKFFDAVNMKSFREKSFVERLPFILVVCVMLVLYIDNSYRAESYVRDISSLERELKDLRSEYITTKSQLMFHSKQTEVQQLVAAQGLEKSITPPLIIRRAN